MAKVEPLLPVMLNVPALPAVVEDNATVPVADRTPPAVTTTVPPDALAAKVPKFSAVPAAIVIGVITVALAVPVAVAAMTFGTHDTESSVTSEARFANVAPDLIMVSIISAFRIDEGRNDAAAES